MLSADLIRGHTDTILLRFLKEGDSYGYAINKRIREISGGEYELNEATLYTAFKRLSQAGFITSYWGEEDSGARRRYYSITDAGREHYEEALKIWDASSRLIEKLVRS